MMIGYGEKDVLIKRGFVNIRGIYIYQIELSRYYGAIEYNMSFRWFYVFVFN